VGSPGARVPCSTSATPMAGVGALAAADPSGVDTCSLQAVCAFLVNAEVALPVIALQIYLCGITPNLATRAHSTPKRKTPSQRGFAALQSTTPSVPTSQACTHPLRRQVKHANTISTEIELMHVCVS
jgi:hypothetical protein